MVLTPIRIGDKFRVINPLRVVRVGYPKSVKDYEKLVTEEALGEFLQKILPEGKQMKTTLWKNERMLRISHSGVGKAIVRETAYVLAKMDGFGGPDRTVHTVEVPEWAGKEFVASHVRSVRIGRYFAPSGSTDYDGNYERESGGLNDAKTVRLLSFHLPNVYELTPNYPFGPNEIERCNVELVSRRRGEYSDFG